MESASTLIVPILDTDEQAISSLYFFTCDNNHLDYYLLLNDADDISYETTKHLIQFFELKLNLPQSNTDFYTKLDEDYLNSNTKTARTVMIECWFYFSGTTSDPYMYYQGSNCSSSASVDFESDRGAWSTNLTGGGSVPNTPTPANGGGGGNTNANGTQNKSTIKWNKKNATPKKLIDCSQLNSISRKSWFDLSNGSKIAHLIDAMRYENKNMRNGGYINLNEVFDFGSINGSDNYTPVFAGRVIINGKIIDVTVDMAYIGEVPINSDGVNNNQITKFNSNVNGYHKTGYWTRKMFYAKNTLTGGSSTIFIDIKLGENTSPMTNFDLFSNALIECNN